MIRVLTFTDHLDGKLAQVDSPHVARFSRLADKMLL